MQCRNCAVETTAAASSRRAFIAGFACVAVTPVTASAQANGPVVAEDERFMRIALEEARKSDFPFGAVIVRDEKRELRAPRKRRGSKSAAKR